MINIWAIIIISLFLLISNCVSFGYGVRIGKAMQKDIPPVPLVEPTAKIAEGIKKVGKRTVKLIKDINESKALKKAQKEETSWYD